MTHTLTLQKIEPVTHDVHHLVFDRPEGYDFTPGQATELALDRDGWRDEKRPFTFVNLPDSDTLEFVIKSYPDHDGVTEHIAKLAAGDTVQIGDAWGAISDEGAGTFIAGGAGVTPFIAVLRDRARRNGSLADCTLVFSNKTDRDIILHDEFKSMPGLKTVFTVTDQDDPKDGVLAKTIDKDFLSEHTDTGSGKFYICGPEPMIDDIAAALGELGVEDGRIVTEDLE